MTRTTVSVQIDTDCHEIIPNDPLAALILKNLERVGPPKFTPEEHTFARRLQESVTREFGTVFKLALDEEVHRIAKVGGGSGSTDVGDISWHVPTCGLRTACFAADAPGHSWQNVAAIGSTIGEKGTVYAAKVLACTALDLLEDPKALAAAKQEFTKRMEGRKYITLIPPGQKAPQSIR
jgi:aminobenzoyl-glutamate utilization protein B